MWILKLGRLKLALRILVLTHKLCHGLTSTLESSYTCVLDMQYVSANTSNFFPFGQCSLFFIHTICSIVLATTKNFSAHAQLPVSASAANVLHVIQHFHVIIIHHSLFFFSPQSCPSRRIVLSVVLSVSSPPLLCVLVSLCSCLIGV